MNERYNTIQIKIKEARESGNTRQLKLWRTKLQKWQTEYGAYAPIVNLSAHKFD